MLTTGSTLLHIRFAGRSEDLDLLDLKLTPAATDNELRAALARRYDRLLAELDDYVVVREPQAIIVRPVAIYG
jgi:hypothetical protein